MPAAKKPGKAALSVDLSLTPPELEMLRDILSVLMPISAPAEGEAFTHAESSVAEYLAAVTGRVKVERKLWKKIVKACVAVDVVVGESAPNFAVSAAATPSLHVYRLED